MKSSISLAGSLCVVLSLYGAATAADRILLWPDGAPQEKSFEENDSNPSRPTLDYYPVRRWANGTAVVICPGGGYGHLATKHEGQQIAEWFNELGVAAFVLRYRHAPEYQEPVPLLDVQRALRYVRSHAEEYHIKPDKIGIMGFSAGGHLASTAATHFDKGDPAAADPVDRVSCRPDFAILTYPVITFTEPYLHKGSRKNLIGNDPSPEKIELYSNERQVTSETPPTFLFHTDADTAVPAENSVAFYLALRKANVPAELHIYRGGRHGGGFWTGDPLLGSWPRLLASWMKGMELLELPPEGNAKKAPAAAKPKAN